METKQSTGWMPKLFVKTTTVSCHQSINRLKITIGNTLCTVLVKQLVFGLATTTLLVISFAVTFASSQFVFFAIQPTISGRALINKFNIPFMLILTRVSQRLLIKQNESVPSLLPMVGLIGHANQTGRLLWLVNQLTQHQC